MLHELAERLVDHAVAGDGALSGEARRDDRQPPVRVAAFAVAGVAAVRLALVDQVERQRFEHRQAAADLGADACLPAHAFSSAYLPSTSACANTNSSIRPMPPNSLKFTQRSVE